jgi:hypothetical protein
VVEPDSAVLDVTSRRIAAFVAAGAIVGTWFVVAPHLEEVGLWTSVVIVSAGVLPGTLLLVLIALPLSRLRWSVLVLVALVLALVALGCSEAGWMLAANFAKLWAAVFAGWAFLYLFADVGLVVLVAAIIPIVDAVSVFTPGAPTHEIVKNHISVYNNVAVAFFAPHGGAAQLGPPDILFYALFLAAADRFRLRVGWTWLATTGLYAASFPIAIATHADGLPALPFLSIGFLAANADLLWKAVRKRA